MAQPSVTSNIQVVNLLSKRRYLIQWSANPEIDILSYNIYRSENQLSGYAKVGSVGLPSTQFIDTVPFTFGVNFFWKVTAVNSSNQESDITSTEAVSDITIGQFDEEPFKQVMVQKNDLIFNEVPIGAKDGVNVVYATLFPCIPATLQFIREGSWQVPTVDFDALPDGSGLSVITSAPLSTESLLVNYVKYFS